MTINLTCLLSDCLLDLEVIHSLVCFGGFIFYKYMQMDPALINWLCSQMTFCYTSLLFLFRLYFTCFGLLATNETQWLEKN